MRKLVYTAALFGLLAFVPAMALAHQSSAQSKPSAPASKSAPKPATPATHATTGVVKSVDATSLVLSKGSKSKDETFMLNSSTEKKGDIAVGAHVQVRYKTEGKENVATAVTVQTKK